ncbi:MAG TPA: hypothetical protein VEI73_01280, partial [Candidatus Acidoferrum sp.]|nr:hypothetical protein [Candidatus Acidoferrum sp.]
MDQLPLLFVFFARLWVNLSLEKCLFAQDFPPILQAREVKRSFLDRFSHGAAWFFVVATVPKATMCS